MDGDWKPPSLTGEMTLTDGYKADEEDGNDVEMRETDTENVARDSGHELLGEDDLAKLGRGTLDEEDVKWWDSWRKRSRKESVYSRSVTSKNHRKRRKVAVVKAEESDAFETDKDRSRTADEFEIDEKTVHEDLRILIKVCYLTRYLIDAHLWILARHHRGIYEIRRSI